MTGEIFYTGRTKQTGKKLVRTKNALISYSFSCSADIHPLMLTKLNLSAMKVSIKMLLHTESVK